MRYDLVSMGEILIDFSPEGHSATGMNLYSQNPGGAPLNVAAVFARYGAHAAFIGRVGADMFGDFMRDYLGREGLDCANISRDPVYPTTLSFVALDDRGEKDCAFCRRFGADIQIKSEHIDMSMPENTAIFHFGSLSMIDEPSRTTTLECLKRAKSAGAVISFDPNFRPALCSEQRCAADSLSVLGQVDILKVSIEEAQLIMGETDPQRCMEELTRTGVKTVLLTLGAQGSMYRSLSCTGVIPAYTCERVVDTTGAGDIFFATFLYAFSRRGFAYGDDAVLRECLTYAAKASGISVTRFGAIPSIPDAGQVGFADV